MDFRILTLLLSCLGLVLPGAVLFELDFDQPSFSQLQAHKLSLKSIARPVSVGSFTGKEYAQFRERIPADSQGFSIAFRMNPDSVTAGDVMTCHNESGNQRAFRINLSRQRIHFTVNDTGRANTCKSVSMPVKTGIWQNVKAVFNPGRLTLTVNGKTAKAPGPDSFFHSNSPITVGMYATGNQLIRPYHGLLSDLTIAFQTAKELSPQIQAPIQANLSNTLDKPGDFKPVFGNWNIKNGVAIPKSMTGGQASLIWSKKLPPDAYRVDVDISLRDKTDSFVPEAYVIINGSADGKSGMAYGLDRRHPKRQMVGRSFPQKHLIARCLNKTGVEEGQEWQRFTLIVNRSCIEMHAPELIMRDYFLNHFTPEMNQQLFGSALKHLVLWTNDPQARFRNLSVLPLDKAPVSPQLEFMIPAQDHETFKTYRPTFRWQPLALNQLEDFTYKVAIHRLPAKTLMEEGTTDEESYRPLKALKPGMYQLTVSAHTFAGEIWGGRISRTFTVQRSNSAVPDDGIRLLGKLTPQHFKEPRPRLTLRWQQHPTADRIAGYLGNRQLFDQDNLQGKQEFTFTPKIDCLPGLNTITINVYHGRRLIDTFELFAVRTQMTSVYHIDAEGILRQGDQIVMPYCTFRDPSDTLDHLDGVKQAQFAITHSYYFEGPHFFPAAPNSVIYPYNFSREKLHEQIGTARKYLRLCQQNGVKVALSIKRHWVRFDQRNLIREFVSALMDEPALATWYLYDEPDCCNVSLSLLRKAYDTIKEIDPYHPVTAVFWRHTWIPRYARCCDILWSQSYGPTPEHVVGHATGMFKMRKAAAAFGQSRHINPQACWIILGAHDLGFKSKNFKNHSPTPQQLETKLLAAMTTPTRGLVYYWLPNNVYDIRKDTPHVWNAVVNSGNIVQKVLPHLLAPGKECPITPDTPGLISRMRQLNSGQRLIILVNTQGKPLTQKLPISATQTISLLAGHASYDTKGSLAHISLAPNAGCALIIQ